MRDAVLQGVTRCTVPEGWAPNGMSFEIEGIRYYTTSEVLEAAGITRQTLWRWRNEAKVPRGNRFRNGRIVFTEQEFRAVIEFANRIEPDAPILDPRQLRLFKDVGS